MTYELERFQKALSDALAFRSHTFNTITPLGLCIASVIAAKEAGLSRAEFLDLAGEVFNAIEVRGAFVALRGGKEPPKNAR